MRFANQENVDPGLCDFDYTASDVRHYRVERAQMDLLIARVRGPAVEQHRGLLGVAVLAGLHRRPHPGVMHGIGAVIVRDVRVDHPMEGLALPAVCGVLQDPIGVGERAIGAADPLAHEVEAGLAPVGLAKPGMGSVDIGALVAVRNRGHDLGRVGPEEHVAQACRPGLEQFPPPAPRHAEGMDFIEALGELRIDVAAIVEVAEEREVGRIRDGRREVERSASAQPRPDFRVVGNLVEPGRIEGAPHSAAYPIERLTTLAMEAEA